MITPREIIEPNRQGVRFEPHAVLELPRPDAETTRPRQLRVQRENRVIAGPSAPRQRRYGAGF